MLTPSEEKLVQYVRHPDSGPRIAVVGGGTGLSTLLRGLKLYTEHLTAIVTVADNGGSSGMLREDLGMLPPGDIRNCILALADTEPLLNDLFNFRFQEGRLQGQNFGNLFIAAMNAVSGNFCEAIRNVSKVLAVKGRVLPVSLQNINIGATLLDGTTILGETEIGHRKATEALPIRDVFMIPEQARPLPEAIQALLQADVIVIGPGSLYTSIIPNLLFPDILRAIQRSKAIKVYVCNIMTQSAETMGYDAARHVDAILRHAHTRSAAGLFDYCVVNSAWIDQDLLERYQLQSAVPVLADKASLEAFCLTVVEAPLACINGGVIRHDHMVLARTILGLTGQDKINSCPSPVFEGVTAARPSSVAGSPWHE